MADIVNTKFIKLESVGEIPIKDIPVSGDQFLIYDGDELKKSPMSNVYDRVNNAYLGVATTSSTPPAQGAYWYRVDAPGTDMGVTVTADDFKDAQGNYYDVTLEVKDGVAVKKKTAKAVSTATAKIETWSAKSYTQGSQVFYNGKIYEANAATVAGDVPGTSTKWVEVFSGVKAKALFNLADNTNPSTMKAVADFLFNYLPWGEIVFNTTNSYITTSGALVSNASWKASDFIPVQQGARYVYYGNNGNISSIAVGGYRADGTFVSTILGKVSAASGVEFFVNDVNISKIRIASDYTVNLKLEGPEGVTAYIKDELMAKVLAKTVFDATNNENPATMKALHENYFSTVGNLNFSTTTGGLDSSGNVVANVNSVVSDFIPVQQNKTYKFFGRSILASYYCAVGYRDDGTFVKIIISGNTNATYGKSFTITDANIAKIRISSWYLYPMRLETDGLLSPYLKDDFLTPKRKIKLNKSWGALGTSITWQDKRDYVGTPSGVNGKARGYQTWVNNIFEFTKYTNFGQSGKSLGGGNSFLAGSYDAHDIFSMESITNDFRLNVPIGTIDDYNNNTGISTYYGALRLFKDRIYTANPNATIIVANALKRNNGGFTSTSKNGNGFGIDDYEIALLNIAKKNDWWFIDQNRESRITDANLEVTTLDGLHPNDFGYKLLSRCWIDEFRRIYDTI